MAVAVVVYYFVFYTPKTNNPTNALAYTVAPLWQNMETGAINLDLEYDSAVRKLLRWYFSR